MTDPRRTLWLLLVLVLVIGLDVGVHASANLGEAPIPTWSGFMDATPDTLVVTRSEVVVRFERADEDWQVVDPYRDAADTAALQALLEGVGRPDLLEARVDTDPEAHATYGLSGMDPIRVQVLGADTLLAELYIGRDGPGRTTFVRLPGEDDVYRSRLGGRGLADRPPGAWRDPSVLDREPDEVLGITITSAASQVALMRTSGLDGDGGWAIQDRPDLPLDEPSVEAVVDAFAGLTALEVLPSAPAELSEPMLIVTLTFADGTETLRFTALRGQAFGLREADSRAFRVRSELLAAVARPAEAWRDRALIRVDPAALTSITLDEGPRQSLLERVDGTWQVTAPVGIDVDGEQASQVVRYLSALEVEGWAVVTDEQAGFPSAVQVVFQGERQWTLQVGGRVPDRPPGREAVFVRLASAPERIGVIPARVWSALQRGWGR